MLRLVGFFAGVVGGAAALLLLSLADTLYLDGKPGLHLIELPKILQLPGTLVIAAVCCLALVCTWSVFEWFLQGTSVTVDIQEDEPVDTEELTQQPPSFLTTTRMVLREIAKAAVATVVGIAAARLLVSLAETVYYGKSGLHLVELPVTLVIAAVCCLALLALDCTWSVLEWLFQGTSVTVDIQEDEPVDTEELTQQPRSFLTITCMVLREIAKAAVAIVLGHSAGCLLVDKLWYGKSGLHFEPPGILFAILVISPFCYLALDWIWSVLERFFQGTSVTVDPEAQLSTQNGSCYYGLLCLGCLEWLVVCAGTLGLADLVCYYALGLHFHKVMVHPYWGTACIFIACMYSGTAAIVIDDRVQQPRSSLAHMLRLVGFFAGVVGGAGGLLLLSLANTLYDGKPGLHLIELPKILQLPGTLVIAAVCCLALVCTWSVLEWLIQGTSVTVDIQEDEPADTEAQCQLTQQYPSCLTTTCLILNEIAKAAVATVVGSAAVLLLLSLADTLYYGKSGVHIVELPVTLVIPAVCCLALLALDCTWSVLEWFLQGTSVTVDIQEDEPVDTEAQCQLTQQPPSFLTITRMVLREIAKTAVATVLGLSSGCLLVNTLCYGKSGLHFEPPWVHPYCKVMIHPYWGTACIFLSCMWFVVRLCLCLLGLATEEPEYLTEVPVGIPVPKMMGFTCTEAQSSSGALVQQQELSPERLVRHMIPSQMLAFLSRTEAQAADRRDYHAAAAARTQAGVVSDRSTALERLWMEEQLAVCKKEYTRAGQLRDQQKLIEEELESLVRGLVTTSSADPAAECPSAPPAEEFEEQLQQVTYFAPPIYCSLEHDKGTRAQTAQMAQEQDCAAAAAQMAQEQDYATVAAQMAQEHEYAAVTAQMAQEQDYATAAAQMAHEQEYAAVTAQMAQEQDYATAAAQMAQEQDYAAITAQMAQEQDYATAAAQMAQEQDYAAITAQMAQEQDCATVAPQMAQEQEYAAVTAQMAHEQDYAAITAQMAHEQDCAAVTAQMEQEQDCAAITAQMAQEQDYAAITAQMAHEQDYAAVTAPQMEQEHDYAAVAPQMAQEQEYAAAAQMEQEQDCAATVAPQMAQERECAAAAQMEQEQDCAAAAAAQEQEHAAAQEHEQEHAAAAQMAHKQEFAAAALMANGQEHVVVAPMTQEQE